MVRERPYASHMHDGCVRQKNASAATVQVDEYVAARTRAPAAGDSASASERLRRKALHTAATAVYAQTKGRDGDCVQTLPETPGVRPLP